MEPRDVRAGSRLVETDIVVAMLTGGASTAPVSLAAHRPGRPSLSYEPPFESQGRRAPAKLSANRSAGEPHARKRAQQNLAGSGRVQETQAKPIFPDPVITLSWAAGWALLLMLHWPMWAPEA